MLVLLVIALAVAFLAIYLNKRNAPLRAAREAEALAQFHASQQRRQAAIAERDTFKENLSRDCVFNECSFKGSNAVFALRKDFKSISVVSYELGEEFHVVETIDIP